MDRGHRDDHMGITTSARKILAGVETADAEVPERFWEITEQYRDELIQQAKAIVGGASDAEDVVQETFCEALRNEEKLFEVHSLGAWLRSINRVNALDLLRKKQRRARAIDACQQDDPRRAVTTGGFSLMETRELLTRAIGELPQSHQEVFKLRYAKHLSLERISEELDMPQGTVGWLLSDASSRVLTNMRHSRTRARMPRVRNKGGAR